MTRIAVRDVIDDLFAEEALLLGGVATVHNLDDEVVGRLVRGIEQIRCRVLRRVDRALPTRTLRTAPRAGVLPHPEIERFLRQIRTGGDLPVDASTKE